MVKVHRVYLSLGANLGDRRTNLLQALQRIRTVAAVEKISSIYETEPVGFSQQPKFLNLACEIQTKLSPNELLRFLKQSERQMGRQSSFRNAPRPIDIDILFFDDLVIDSPDLILPHPCLAERAFVLVPLAEIAPDLLHPVLQRPISELLGEVDQSGVKPLRRGFRIAYGNDIQKSTPPIHVSLSRVGVTDMQRILRITHGGRENLFYAEIDLYANLDPRQMGVHMSRFTDVLDDVVDELALETSPNIETLAARIAAEVVERQQAVRAEVNIRAVYPMEKTAPVSGKKMQELYTLIGLAVATRTDCKRVVGVEADGMTVCPCAQDMVREYSAERLQNEGFSDQQTNCILDAIPIASHNQRGRGTLLIGADQEVQADDLVGIIEASMSSETYDLLKRPDELFVVNRAHRNPRFVEDVVREMLQNVVEIYDDLPDSSFVLAKQTNLESIHKHNAFAERSGTLGEIRQEILASEHLFRHTTLQEWLEM